MIYLIWYYCIKIVTDNFIANKLKCIAGLLRGKLRKGLSRMKGNFHVRFLGDESYGNVALVTRPSPPIAKAIVDAKRRGVDVKIILDKSQYNAKKYSSALFFEHEDIPVWIDYKVNIAHNKVMVIDNEIVITGSFNFTKNAQEHNAENLLIIKSPELAKIYTKNWYNRLAASTTLASYKNMPRNKHHKDERAKHHRRSQSSFEKFEKSLHNL